MMTVDAYFLGVDMGGTAVKAAVFDAKGKECSVAVSSTKLITPKPGYTERDMDEFYEKICYVIKEAVSLSKVEPGKIIAMSCTGHGKGLYLWGKNNRPVGNGIISTDRRAAEIADHWRMEGVEEKIFPFTYQDIHASQPCCLLKWVKENEPETYGNIKWVFEAKDYIRFRLTGNAWAELTDYSGTNLLNLESRDFDKQLFDTFGIGEMLACMPPVCGAFDHCGIINEESAKETGLNPGTVVAGGMFDIDACALAMNMTSEDYLCVIAGTWGINEYISAKPVLDSSVSRNSIYCLPEFFLIEESSPTSASNLEWVLNNVLHEIRSEAEVKGEAVYTYIEKLVESIGPEECGVYYLPFVFGGNTNPYAKGTLAGLDASSSKAHMLRAVYEGIVYCHKSHVDKLLVSRRGNRPKAIRLAGGAARSRVWVQIFADILGFPIEVVKVNELGTLGCAVNAAITSGYYRNVHEALANMSAPVEVFYPNNERMPEYIRKYEIYTEICNSLDKVWKKMQT